MPFNPSTTDGGVGGYPVTLTDITSGQVLEFDTTTMSWVNTTPSSGGVTSISNSDGSLTISPTTGASVASLNVAHANTWSALQTFSSGLTVSAGTITFDTVPQASQGGYPENTAYGTGALNSNVGNTNCTAVGAWAGYSNSTGYYNSFFGGGAGYSNRTGGYNSFFGFYAGYSNLTTDYNAFFGYYAGASTTASYNSFFGGSAGYKNTSGYANSFFGYAAGYNYNNTSSVYGYLVLIGYEAGYNYTGSETNNIVIGYVEGTAGESGMLRIGNNNVSYITAQMTSMKGLGYAPIYGAGLLVSIGTTATTIATYTPTSSTGQFFVVKWVLSASAAATPTLTLTFTDPKAGAQTVTLYNTAMSADTVAQGTYVLVATSAAAITVSATASVAGDIFGSVTIDEEQ